MKDIRFSFERTVEWPDSYKHAAEGLGEYARRAFKRSKDEVYETVRNIEEEWKVDNSPGAGNWSSFIEEMNSQIVFIHVHVYPLEIEMDEGTRWDITLRGDVHVRVKGDPPDEDVWKDIQQCIDDCCGETTIIR